MTYDETTALRFLPIHRQQPVHPGPGPRGLQGIASICLAAARLAEWRAGRRGQPQRKVNRLLDCAVVLRGNAETLVWLDRELSGAGS